MLHINVIRKIQIKKAVRYHYILLRMPRFRTLATPNANENVEHQEFLYIAGRSAKWNRHFGRQSEVLFCYKAKYILIKLSIL